MPKEYTLDDVNAVLGGGEVDPNTSLPADTTGKGITNDDVSTYTSDQIDAVMDNADKSTLGYLGEGDFGLDPTEYDFQLKYDADNAELRAQNQSATGMIAKGIARLGGTTLTKLASGVGYIATALPALVNWDLSTMTDNGFSEMMRETEEGIKEALPIHKTRKYLDGNILDQMGTLGFWTDDVVDGAAFMLSSIIGAKGMSAAAKGLGAYSKIARQFSALSKAAKTGSITGEASELLTPALKNWVNRSTMATISTMNSVSEAAFEAKDIKDNVMRSLQNKIELGEMTQEEANLVASKAARNTFWTNMVLLAPSNFLETSMILKRSDDFKLNKLVKDANISGRTAREVATELPERLTKKQIIGQFADKSIKSALTEGIYEEGFQNATQAYNMALAEGKHENEAYVNGIVRNWVEGFSTDEGQKSMVLGAIMGLIPGGVGGVSAAKQEMLEFNQKAQNRAIYADMASKDVTSIMKRKPLYDNEGNVIGESDELDLDENKQAQIDEDKFAAVYGNSQDQYIRYVEALKALYNNDMDTYRYIRNDTFNNYVFRMLQDGSTAEDLSSLIDSFSKREQEDLQDLNLTPEELEEQEEQLHNLKNDYIEKSKKLVKVYNSILNNYAGLQDFGKGKDAIIYQQGLIAEQFSEAARQLYLNEEYDKLNKEILNATSRRANIPGVQGLTDPDIKADNKELKAKKDRLSEYREAIDRSETKLKDLLDTKKQKARYKEIVKAREEARRAAATDDRLEDEANGVSTTTESNSVELADGSKTNKMTPELAGKNGYKIDYQKSLLVNDKTGNTGPSYYYKVDNDNGTMEIIYTDGTEEGNIRSKRFIKSKEVEDASGNRGRLNLNFLNGELTSMYVKGYDSGEMHNIPVSEITRTLGTTPTVERMSQIIYNAQPKIGGWIYSNEKVSEIRPETFDVTGEQVVEQKTLNQHRQDIINQLAEGITLSTKDVNKQYAYYDAESSNIPIKTLVDRLENNTIPVLYGESLMEGILYTDEYQVIFKDNLESKEYIVAGKEATETLEELDVLALSTNYIGFEYMTDGRPYPIKIHDNYYKNAFPANPSKAITTDGQNPTSVTLIDTKGQTHNFKDPNLVPQIAFGIELNELLIDRAFTYLLGGAETDALVVTDPKTGVDYAVYRKDGQYEVYYIRENETKKGYKKVNHKGLIYDRVVAITTQTVNKALEQAALNKPANQKQVENEIKSNAESIRPANSGENLSLPTQAEVSSSKESKKATATPVTSNENIDPDRDAEPKTTNELEDYSNKISDQIAAMEEAARKKYKEQKEATAEVQNLNDILDLGDDVETITEDEDKTGKVEVVYEGTKHSNDNVSYRWYNEGTKQFIVNNGEFLEYVINNNITGGFVEAQIDYDYRKFWDTNPKLEAAIKGGKITRDLLNAALNKEINDETRKALNANNPKFRRYVDMIPIKLVFKDSDKNITGGLYIHQSDFRHIRPVGQTPQEIAANKEIEMGKTRALRGEILTHQLSGFDIEYPISGKSIGHLNLDPKTNLPLRDIVEGLQDPLDDVKLGLALTDGMISMPGEEFAVGKSSSRGGVFWRTNRTANGDYINVRLNPAKISTEHASIVLKALKQAYEGGNLNNKYIGSDVTGDLTLGEVLKLITFVGKKNTQVQKNDKSKSKQINKQLWHDKQGILYYGESTLDLKSMNDADVESFINWASTNKNYAIMKPFLGGKVQTESGKSFSIGSTMKYDADKGTYNRMLLESDMLLTRVRVVKGTRSITSNPNVYFDYNNPYIGQATETVEGKVEMKPKTQADVKAIGNEKRAQNPTVTAQVKEEIAKIEDDANERTTELKLKDIRNITKLSEGTEIYIFNPDVSQDKGPIGTVQADGTLKFTTTRYEGSLESLNNILRKGTLDVNRSNQKGTVNKLNKYAGFLHFDKPQTQTTEESKAEVEHVKEVEQKQVEEVASAKPETPTKPTITTETPDFTLDIEDIPVLGKVMRVRGDLISTPDGLKQLNKYFQDQFNTTDNVIIPNTFDVAEEYHDQVEDLYAGDSGIDEEAEKAEIEKLAKEAGIDPTILDMFSYDQAIEYINKWGKKPKPAKDIPDTGFKPNNGIVDTGDRTLDDIDMAPFKMALDAIRNTNYNVGKARKWLRNKLGESFDIEVAEGLIKLAGNRNAYGQATRDAIKLSDVAATGTEYHEAFHRVSLFLISEKDRNRFYRLAREQYGISKDVPDRIVEERLANEFMNYMLARDEEITTPKQHSFIKRVFSRIFNFIRGLFGRNSLNNKSINQLFKMIEDGKFKGVGINPNSFGNKYGGTYANFEIHGANFDYIDSSSQYREVVKYLFSNLFMASGIVLPAYDIKSRERTTVINLENGLEDIEKLSYTALKEQLNILLNRYTSVANYGTDPNQQKVALHVTNILNDILKNYDAVIQDLEDFMATLNIRVKKDLTEIDNPELLDEETGETVSNPEVYDKASFESSAKHNTAATIKLLLSILPAESTRNQATGLPTFADFGTIWSDILRSTTQMVTADDMMTILENKSKGDQAYSILLRYVSQNENLKTQLYKTLSKARMHFVLGNITSSKEGIDILIGDSLVSTASSDMIRDWNSNFVNHSKLFKNIEGKGTISVPEAFGDIRNEYLNNSLTATKQWTNDKKLVDFQPILASYLNSLNSIGITISDEQIKAILPSIDANEDYALTLLITKYTNHIFSDSGTLYKYFEEGELPKRTGITTMFKNESSVKFLAESINELDPTGISDSLLAHAGKRFYLVADNTNLTDQLNEYKNKTEEKVNNKLQAVINKNSRYLKHFKDNPKAAEKLQLRTLSSVFREKSGDEGRGYKDVTDKEEYLVRMVANNKGYGIMPTPADRSFYQYLEGVPKIGVTIDSEGNLNQNTIDVFKKYYEDEANRVILTKKQVDNAINFANNIVGEGQYNPDNLIENLHYKFHGSNTVEEGQIVIATDTKGKWVQLAVGQSAVHGNGKLLKKGGQYTGRGAEFLVFTGRKEGENLDSYIARILKNMVKQELEYANELGIISSSGREHINELIPLNVLNKAAAIVGDNTTAKIEQVIADFTINTIAGGIEMGKFFASDIASFKSVTDFLKRITGYTSTGENLRTNYPKGVWANDELITSDTYNTTTLTSREFESEMYNHLMPKYIKYYMDKQGLTEAQAKKISEDKLSGYKSVDQTDAQTYITNEMYRALSIKLGEWTQTKEEAYQLLISGKELEESEWVQLHKLVSQPLKMVYMQSKTEEGQSYSIFDKMSLATIFRPTVKGLQLEKILDRMELKGDFEGRTDLQPIHHLKFHTAQKSGTKDRRDLFIDPEGNNLTDMSLFKVYPQEFKWLRKQLVTDPHESKHIALGSQIKKIAISNIRFTDAYTNLFDDKEKWTGLDLVKAFHEVIGELSNRGIDGFKQELNLDDNFFMQDKEAIVEKLRDEARRSAMPQHVIDALKVEDGDFVLDFDSMPDARRWLQSRLISLVKKAAIDTNLPGNQFIQMSDLGLRSIEKDDSLRWITEDGYVEARASVNLFKHIIPNYQSLTHEQRVEWLDARPELVALGYRVPTQGQNSNQAVKVVEWLPESTGDIIVMPAEHTMVGGSDFDVDKMFMVRHNYDKKGDRIKYLTDTNSTVAERLRIFAESELKDQKNKIYKKYIEKSGISTNRLEQDEYDRYIKGEALKAANTEFKAIVDEYVDSNLESFSKRPIIKQNTLEAVQNRLLDIMFTSWHNDNNLVHKTQPLGYGANKLKKLAYKVRDEWEKAPSIEGIPLMYLSPKEQIDVKSRFKFGAAGIGPNALASVHHILSQSVDLGLFEYIGVGNKSEQVKGVEETIGEHVDEVINIYAGSGENLILSNFANTPFTYLGREFDNVEQAFQEAKLAYTDGSEYNVKVYNDIATNSSASYAKKRGRAYKNFDSKRWDKDSYNIMKRFIEAKFTQNESAKKALLETGDAILTHTQDKSRWGVDFPKILMEVRKDMGGGVSELTKKVTTLSALQGEDGEYITEWFSALMDAHVDIGADPWIYYLNANDYTNNVITLLLRAGVGGEKTMKFIAQPILKEIAKARGNVGDKLRKNMTPLEISQAKGKIAREIEDNYKGIVKDLDLSYATGKRAVEKVFGNEKLLERGIEAVGNGNSNRPEWVKFQIEVYEAFKYLNVFAKDLSAAILSSRVDTKKFGSSITEIISYMNGVEKELKKTRQGTGIRNLDKLFANTYLGNMTDNAIGVSKSVISSTMLEGTPAFLDLHNAIMEQSGRKFEKDEKLVKAVSNAIYTEIASRFFVYDEARNPAGYTWDRTVKMFSGNTSIPKKIEAIKSNSLFADVKEVKDNPLFKLLHSHYIQDGPHMLNVRMPEDKFDVDRAVDGWRDLYLSDNEAVSQFALDLFAYSYFTSGFRPGANSFFNLAPEIILKDSGFDNYIRSMKNAGRETGAFNYLLDDVMLSLSDNDNIVKDATPYLISGVRDNAAIAVAAEDLRIGETEKGEMLGIPYVQLEGRLYKFAGYNPKTNSLSYYNVARKGYKEKQYRVVENSFEKSMFKINYTNVDNNVNAETLLNVSSDFLPQYGVYASLELKDTIIVDPNSKIKIFDDGVETYRSDRIREELLFNPLEGYGLSKADIDLINSGQVIVQLSKTVPNGFYTLPNGKFVFLENVEVGTVVSTYGYTTPSYPERKQRINECK